MLTAIVAWVRTHTDQAARIARQQHQIDAQAATISGQKARLQRQEAVHAALIRQLTDQLADAHATAHAAGVLRAGLTERVWLEALLADVQVGE